MPTIMFCNLKGGVAKTTNAVAVAECLANAGKPTLLIDADHQCTASEFLLGERGLEQAERQTRTLHDLMASMLRPDFDPNFSHYVQQDVSNIGGGLADLSILPCSLRIDDFQTNMARGGRGFATWDEYRKMFYSHRRKLNKWLKEEFAYVIIDCPPSIAIQVRLLLGIADYYIIPCVPNRLSIRGAISLQDRLRRANLRRARCLGTIWSMRRGNDAKHGSVVDSNADGIVPRPFETVVPMSAGIAHAWEDLETIPSTFKQKYGHQFARVYESLTHEIIERISDDGDEPLELEAMTTA